MVLRNSPKREVYERTYLKIQNVAANISGIINLALIIGQFIVYIYNLTLYKLYFIYFFNQNNKIFTYKFNDKNIISNTKRKSFNLKKIKLLKNNYFDYQKELNKSLNFEKRNSKNNDSSKIFNKDFSFLKTEKKNNTNKLLTNFKNKLCNQINDSNSNSKQYITNQFYCPKKSSNISNNLKIENLDELESSKVIILESNIPNKKINDENNYNIKLKINEIKTLNFCLRLICQRFFFHKILNIHKKYSIIKYLFDLVYYIKMINDINIIKNLLFNFEQRIYFADNYCFDSDFIFEKIGYERKEKNTNNNYFSK